MAKLKRVQNSLVAIMFSALVVGCGASRSKKFSACSSLKAVADFETGAPKTFRPGESYDPSSVMLVFKASSDKISLESRCNARLMHKLVVENRNTMGNFREVGLALSGFALSDVSESALELHTSAHCFFRIWDSRVASQVENNPELSSGEVRKILGSDFERYKLYKSLLSSPQKLYAFSVNGEPIEFSYKLKNATDVYANFFARIDQYNNGLVNEYIGREFSKTSIMLDELALDVCSADEKLVQRADIESRLSGLNSVAGSGAFPTEMISELKDLTSVPEVKDLFRRKAIHNGKHKICFSQSDLVVAPITLTDTLTEQQQAHLAVIHSKQKERSSEAFDMLQASINQNPPEKAEENTRRFITEFYGFTKPSPIGNSCSWTNQYPALSVSFPLMDLVQSGLMNWNQVSDSEFATVKQYLSVEIPQFKTFLGIEPVSMEIHNFVNRAPRHEACRIRGGSFSEKSLICTERTNSSIELSRPEYGFCPPTDPSNFDRFRKEAARIQLNVSASLRLAAVSALQTLERYRMASDEILLLPLAALHGMSSLESRAIDNSIAKIVFSQLKELKQDKHIGSRVLVVEKVDAETIPVCQLRTSAASVGPDEELVIELSSTFQNFSSFAVSFIKGGLKGTSPQDAYNNFAVRYLNTRCIGAGIQLLYNGWEQTPGLLQSLGFADVSMVLSGAIPANGRLAPSTRELIESARTVSVPFSSLILGHEFSSNSYPQQIGAQLIASGHMQVGACIASEHHDEPRRSDYGSYDDFRNAMLDYRTLSKDLFCNASPGHKEYVKRVMQQRTLYEKSEGDLGPIFDLLDNEASPFIYEKMSTKAVADALPRMFGHLNFITAVPEWLPAHEKAKYGLKVDYAPSFENKSGRYFLTAGDSGTTISMFGLFPIFMLSTVQDVPVSGGIAVIPSTSGQEVQSGKGSGCR